MESLRHWLLIGTICGGIGGVTFGLGLKQFFDNWTEREVVYIKFPGELFIRLVNCLIIPLITSSIVSASCNVARSGRIGLMALLYYMTTTTTGIVLCVVLTQTIKPGVLLETEATGPKISTQKNYTAVDALLDLLRNLMPDNIIAATLTQYQTVLKQPDNPDDPIERWPISGENVSGTNVLGLVFLSLTFGFAIGSVGTSAKPLLDFFQALSDVTARIMDWVIMAVPLSVFCLLAGKILEVKNFAAILRQLGVFILTVFTGLSIQGFVLLPLVYLIATRRNPYRLISRMGPAILAACGTSSSTATVPVTIKCLDAIGIDKRVTRFVVPIGSAINMDGIALYESIGAIFIIQLRGMEFPLVKIIVISIGCTISCIGAAGLPNGGYVMLITVLNSFGVPAEDVSLIIAIDWFVDRFRTTINIIGDALGAGIISHHYEKWRPTEESRPMNEQSAHARLSFTSLPFIPLSCEVKYKKRDTTGSTKRYSRENCQST